MVHVIAVVTVKPEMKAELVAAARDCIAATRREQGCIAYDLFASTTDPDRLVFVEEWKSDDDLQRHMKNDHVRTFVRIAVTCFAAPVQVQIITPEKIERR